MSAMWYEAAVDAHPEIPDEIRQGEFSTLRRWLSENIHTRGRKFTTSELVKKVTGGELTTKPYLRYLEVKYGELYQL